MPALFSSPPKIPAAPAIPAPLPQPVPAGANNAGLQAQQAQTIARTQAISGRQSTDLTGSSSTLGGN